MAIVLVLASGCHQDDHPPLPAEAYCTLPVVFRPRWNPAGDQLAYLLLEQGERHVTVVDTQGKKTQLSLPDQQLFRFLTWGPDSQSLTVGYEGPYQSNQQLAVFDLDDGSQRPLVYEPKAFHEIGSFSQDGRTATLSSNARHLDRYDIDLLDVGTGARKTVYQGKGRCIGLRFWGSHQLLISEDTTLTGNSLSLLDLQSKDAKSLAGADKDCRYLNPMPSGENLLLITDDGSELPYLAWMHPATGQLTALTQFKPPVADYAFLRKRGLLAVLLEEEDGQRIVISGPDDTLPIHQLDLKGGYARHLKFLDAHRLSYLYSRWDCPPTVMVWDLGQSEPEVFLSGEHGHLDLPRISRPLRIEYDSQGWKIPAWLYSPPVPTGDAVILLAHGPGQQAGRGFQPQVQFWVDRGWAVLVPDFRGSSGHGRKFAKADDQKLRGSVAWDVVAGAKALHERQLSRVHLLGYEYGGYLAAKALLLSPESFIDGVVLNPHFDLQEIRQKARPWQRQAWQTELGETNSLDLSTDVKQLKRPLLVLRNESSSTPSKPFEIVVKSRAEALEKAWTAFSEAK